MTNPINIDSCGVNFTFDSPIISDVDSYRDFAGHIIPRIRTQYNERKPTFSVTMTPSPNSSMSIENGNMMLEGSYNIGQLTMDGVMLSSMYLEKILNNLGMYSLHSSAVTKDGKGILLIGNSGAGKTTVAHSLSKNAGYTMISGDRTVVSDDRIIGGTEVHKFRKGTLAHESGNENQNGSQRSEFVKLHGDAIVDEPTLDQIILVERKEGDPNYRELIDDEKFLRLYENADYFRNVFPNVILGQKKPLPWRATWDEDAKRIAYVTELVKSVPAYHLSGNLEDITRMISEGRHMRG
jgi:ABC-type cobalamin/Fe3+-siderophores transport system ATPase subunit